MKRISITVKMSESAEYNATETPSLEDFSLSLFNLTLAANDSQQGDACHKTLFFFIVYGPLYGVLCGGGIVGNTLSFAVLHKYSRSNVSTYLLKSLAVMDNIFLATAACIQMYQGMVMYYDLTEELMMFIYPYLQTYVWPLSHISQTWTVWMMVLVAFNRYIAVCKPLHASYICTKRNVKIQIAVMATTIVVYNIPRFFEYHSVLVTDTDANNVTTTVETEAGLTSIHLYNILYENLAYCLFLFLVPLLVLIFFNVHLVHDLKKAQRNRRALMGRGSVEENNITLVMIVIIIVFIVCQTPAAINQVLWYVVDASHKKTCASYMKYNHLCNLVILINSSVNFVIYCLFRRQFQQELSALVCRSCKRQQPHKPLRRTVLLRALHERTSSLRDNMTYSMYLRETSQEDVPLKDNSCENPNFCSQHDENHHEHKANGKRVHRV